MTRMISAKEMKEQIDNERKQIMIDISKIKKVGKCKICQSTGHNRKTCPKKPPQSYLIGNGRKGHLIPISFNCDYLEGFREDSTLCGKLHHGDIFPKDELADCMNCRQQALIYASLLLGAISDKSLKIPRNKLLKMNAQFYALTDNKEFFSQQY